MAKDEDGNDIITEDDVQYGEFIDEGPQTDAYEQPQQAPKAV